MRKYAGCRKVKFVRGNTDGRAASIGVIGAGIFGVSAALELRRLLNASVTLYERRDDVLKGASARNLFRLHRGYHYPRDTATAQQARDGYRSFVHSFGAAVEATVPHHYAIASSQSRTSPEEFRTHCDRLNIRARSVRVPYLSQDSTQACFEVDEAYVDMHKLRKLSQEQLSASGVQVSLASSTTSTDIARIHDYIVVATYGSMNDVLAEIECPTMKLQYELCEVPVIRCPSLDRCSVVVMDGPFMSVAPYRDDLHLLYDVVESVHERVVDNRGPDFSAFRKHLDGPPMTVPSTTRLDAIMMSARRFLGPLDDFTHVGSLFAVRVVLPGLETSDARPTLVQWVAPNVVTILSGKMSVAVDAGRVVAREVESRLDQGLAVARRDLPASARYSFPDRSTDGPETPTVRRSVFVTGAGGFIGTRLVARLLGGGYKVVAVDHDVTRLQDLHRHQGAERLRTFHCDVTNAGAIATAMRQEMPNAVVHLAAKHIISQCESSPTETLQVNIIGLINTLAAADQSGSELMVFASTADVYAPSDRPLSEDDPVQPTNVYGASKFLGERLVAEWRQRQADRHSTSVRIFNVYGVDDKNPHVIPEILRNLARRGPIQIGNLEPRRDFIHVDDVADVICRVIETPEPPTVVNAGTGLATSIGELLAMLEDMVDGPLVWEHNGANARSADRLHLQAETSRMRALVPDLVPRKLPAGLRETLARAGVPLGTASSMVS